MESHELPQMDPRVLKATSVKAEDPAAQSPEPQALKITAASSNPKMFTLPWEKPLATWPEDLLVNLPRGISRHVVPFVHVGSWNCLPCSLSPWSPAAIMRKVSRWKPSWSPSI